jgi:hypothetical protein
MAEPLPVDVVASLLQAVGSLDALEILLLLRRKGDRDLSPDDIARELGLQSDVVEATLAELRSKRPFAMDRPDATSGAREDRRLELVLALCTGAMQHTRELADLLGRALAAADPNDLAFENQLLEQAALTDGFLQRAAQRGIKLVDIERAYVHVVLHVVGGNKSEAARRLGINRRTLQRRLGGEDETDDEDDDAEDQGDDGAHPVQS